ncbi:MAG TPA: hypothetical protein VFJ16_29565 [Longimicrobium sp.]|nr:hypothetical protein [Longimicrobium sp.]
MKIFQMLERSSATESFRDALERFLRDGRPNERIAFNRDCPAVKVERWLTKALEEYPELHIESIEMRALSGCEYFRGFAEVHTAAEVRRVNFHWDCRWKAQEMGWEDYFGYPDQIRAAREFGYDCFRTWAEEGVKVKAVALAGELDEVGSGEPVPA